MITTAQRKRVQAAEQLGEELQILATDLMLAASGDCGAINRVESYIDGHWHKLVIGPAWKVALAITQDDDDPIFAD